MVEVALDRQRAASSYPSKDTTHQERCIGIGCAEASGSECGRGGGARILGDIVVSFLCPQKARKGSALHIQHEAAQSHNSLEDIQDGQPEGPAEIHSEGGMGIHLRPRIDLLKFPIHRQFSKFLAFQQLDSGRTFNSEGYQWA